MLNLIWKIRWFNKMNKKNMSINLTVCSFVLFFSVLSGTQGVFGIISTIQNVIQTIQ